MAPRKEPNPLGWTEMVVQQDGPAPERPSNTSVSRYLRHPGQP